MHEMCLLSILCYIEKQLTQKLDLTLNLQYVVITQYVSELTCVIYKRQKSLI